MANYGKTGPSTKSLEKETPMSESSIKEPTSSAHHSEEATETLLCDGNESNLPPRSVDQPLTGGRCPVGNQIETAPTVLQPGRSIISPTVGVRRSVPDSTRNNRTSFCVCDQGTDHPYQSLRRSGSLSVRSRTRTVSHAAFFNPGQGLSISAVVTYPADDSAAADRARLLQGEINEFFAIRDTRSPGTKNDVNDGMEAPLKKERLPGRIDTTGGTEDVDENAVAEGKMGGTPNVIGGGVGGLGVIEISDDEEDFCRCDEVDSNSGAAVEKEKNEATVNEGIVLDAKASRFTSLFRDASRNAINLRTTDAPTYTPLQRWEFENGLPVHGVSDVRTWAVAVGLARDLATSVKKMRTGVVEEPPKYGNSTFTITDIPNDDESRPSPSEEPENERHAVLERRRKGKDKEDNLQD